MSFVFWLQKKILTNSILDIGNCPVPFWLMHSQFTSGSSVLITFDMLKQFKPYPQAGLGPTDQVRHSPDHSLHPASRPVLHFQLASPIFNCCLSKSIATKLNSQKSFSYSHGP